jgi:hypothetical protein
MTYSDAPNIVFPSNFTLTPDTQGWNKRAPDPQPKKDSPQRHRGHGANTGLRSQKPGAGTSSPFSYFLTYNSWLPDVSSLWSLCLRGGYLFVGPDSDVSRFSRRKIDTARRAGLFLRDIKWPAAPRVLRWLGRYMSKCPAWRHPRRLLNPWRQGRTNGGSPGITSEPYRSWHFINAVPSRTGYQ